MMYKLNKMLITEQMRLEEEARKSLEDAAALEAIQRINEFFQTTLETYLQLPHKVKPIFDRLKHFEHKISKFYKADPQLLYELTSDIVHQYKAKCE